MIQESQIASKYSHFLRRSFHGHPDWQRWVEERLNLSVTAEQIEALFVELSGQSNQEKWSEDQIMWNLRKLRQKVMLWLCLRDLNHLASLSEVTMAMTTFAERAIKFVSTYSEIELATQFGRPKRKNGDGMPLWILGMGKLGGKELNVSSDIDLIFIYEEEGETQGAKRSLSHHEWFLRLGRQIIKLLNEYSEDGFVFRVDMRLRPNGESGPLVCSLDMLEEYFLIQGREWERYAWIKSRLVYPIEEATMHGLPPILYSLVRPFVYRKYLDYGVIKAIRDLHRQIRNEANVRAVKHPERIFDIKLGQGGIREIEFLAQMFQLLRGGVEPRLRLRPTLNIIHELAELQLIEQELAVDLVKIYTFYRQVEHRLQWRNDAQVHHLNNEIEELQHLSESMGFSEPRDFLRTITHYQEKIKKTFADTIFSEKEQTEAVIVNEPLLAQSPKFTKRLEIIRAGNKYTLMSDAAKHNFENIIKVVILLKPDPPENVLIDFLDFLEKISRRAAYLSLLSEYPIAIKRVIQLFESSKWSVQYLVRYPHLLDEILVKNTSINLIENPGNYWKDWLRVLQRRLDAVSAEENATELMMNILRDAHHAEIFQILLADLGIGLNQRLSVEKVSDQLSQLADLIITETLERIWKQMSQRFGYQEHFSSLGFGVIAYGKLGGKELGYGSDLDLVFIYDEDISTLPKDDVPERYIQLVRKLITWLNTSTSSGIIFDIDTRLRPNGESGLMVTSLKSFEKYQFNDGNNTAWIWEHQALSRARYCSGDVRVGDSFEKIRAQVLSKERDINHLRYEVIEMRKKIHLGHPNLTKLFDIKHDEGGMVDIEFIIQFMVLAHAYQWPKLIQNIGNIALLNEFAELKLIDDSLASQVVKAYRLFRQSQHRLRLDGISPARIELENNLELASSKDAVIQLWQSVFLKL
ncbi:MAG: bifunctional [glutamate--ammonia ligase]-adenylyl-L-tyrosine phosphorylase/[glutamate--ammonia-ligase] adenylyltransferase [Betaproteobacteria bacterium]